MPLAGKNHGDLGMIGGVNHFLVFNGTSGLNDGPDSVRVRHLNVIRHREKPVAC